MKPRTRKAKMVMAGIKQTEIANQLGIHPSAVCKFVNGKLRSRRIAKAIDEALAKPGKAAA